MFRIRMIFRILKDAGMGWITLVFMAVFFACCLVIGLTEPSIRGNGDIFWMCFQAVTTIGFGDVTPTDFIPRATVVFLSVCSIFYLAIITGTVVYYCNEVVRVKHEASVQAIQDKLEHLDELSTEELAELSRKIRNAAGG